MRLNKKIFVVFLLAGLIYLSSCQQPGGNVTGSEYMPDMSHSIAYEANSYNYYYNNTWGSEEEYYEYAKPRKPVSGTVARGFAGDKNADFNASGISHAPSGNVPYYYGNTEEERNRAIVEIINNPYPITEDGLARGKELYDVFCGICHGDKADGAGYLVRDPNPATGDAGGKYPVQPANMLLDEFVSASNGRYYHAIMFGKNMMGAYKDKLSYEERWQVIHYIRSLQAKDKGMVYNNLENTLNNIDIPGGEIVINIHEEAEMGEIHESHDDHSNH